MVWLIIWAQLVSRLSRQYCVGGLEGSRAGLNALEKTWIFCPCQESNPDSSVVLPVASSLYLLSYPGFICLLSLKTITGRKLRQVSRSPCRGLNRCLSEYKSRLLLLLDVNLFCGFLSYATCDIWVIVLCGNYRLALPAATAVWWVRCCNAVNEQPTVAVTNTELYVWSHSISTAWCCVTNRAV